MNTYRARIAAPAELKECREAWNRLALGMAAPTVFCTWEWIFDWWECFGQNQQLLVLFVMLGEKLKGILPLSRQSGVPSRSSWVVGRTLRYCGSKDLFADQVDIICAPEDLEPCADALVRFLQGEYTAWDTWEIPLVKSDSGLAICADRMSRDSRGGRATDWHSTSHAPFIVPNGRSFEEYVATLDKYSRYEIRRRAKEMISKELHYTPVDPGAEADAIATLFELHAARALQKGVKSTFDDAPVRRFHEQFSSSAARNGWLWLRLLKQGAGTVAAFYGFEIGGRVYYFNSGFDPAFEKLSPGKSIIDGVLREAFAKGSKEFNFLQGDERYKSGWTPDKHVLFSGRIYNRGPLGRLNWAVMRARSAAKHIRASLTPS